MLKIGPAAVRCAMRDAHGWERCPFAVTACGHHSRSLLASGLLDDSVADCRPPFVTWEWFCAMGR